MSQGTHIEKNLESSSKKQIIAKKMGGNANRPNSWSKTVEPRNKNKDNSEDKFSKGERSKESKGTKARHGKEPGASWTI